MSELEAFVRTRLEAAECAAGSRDTNAPIHETGCYYYNNTYDPAYCDCDGPMQALRAARAQIALLDDITAEKHLVVDGDCWFTCYAAKEDRDGGENCNDNAPDHCSCGRDDRVERRLRLMAYPFKENPDYEPEWLPDEVAARLDRIANEEDR